MSGPRKRQHGATLSTNPDALALIHSTTGPRIDSRLLARQLGKRHQSTYEQIKDRRADFEKFGKVRFETGASEGGKTGQKEHFALLTEDQAFFLLSLSRNSARVVEMKVCLIQAFSKARRAAEVRTLEYAPAYHALHDAIKQAARGSPNERFMHMNANKAVNKLAGIEAGQRPTAGPLQQSLLAVGSAMAARALQDTHPGKVQDRIKLALQPLAGLLALPGTEVSA